MQMIESRIQNQIKYRNEICEIKMGLQKKKLN